MWNTRRRRNSVVEVAILYVAVRHVPFELVAGRTGKVEAIVSVVVRCVPGEFIVFGRTFKVEAIVSVAVRRVPSKSVAGRTGARNTGKEEAKVYVVVRRVPGKSVFGRTVKVEAIEAVAVRRVPCEGVAGSTVDVEAIDYVVVGRVPCEGVAGSERARKDKANSKSRDFAVLDRDSCTPTETNPITCARPAYSVPGAVEGYTVHAYYEPKR